MIGWLRPNYRLDRPLFIREVNASFGNTQHPNLQCTSLGAETVATGNDVKEGFGQSILRNFLLGFLPHEGFPR